MNMSLRGKQCPVCEEWYADWATRCPVCGVALVHGDADADAPGAAASPEPAEPVESRSRRDDIDILALPEDEQLVYELAEWSLSMRSEVAAALAEVGVPHGWDGTDLLVHLDDEAEVDAVCERIEAELGTGAAGTVPGDGADDAETTWPDGTELLEYDLGPWSAPLRRALVAQLSLARVAHRLEGGATLVVAAPDEVTVEEAIDRVSATSTVPPEGAEGGGAGDGGDDEIATAAMSDLFLAADRLQRDRDDREGLRLVSDTVDDLDASAPPFGVDPAAWQQVVGTAEALADALADEAADDEVVADHARTLRNLLRPMV